MVFSEVHSLYTVELRKY